MDLCDRDRFRGLKYNFEINKPILFLYTSKFSQKDIKGGYLSHLLGFEVTEQIQGTEAVLEAETVTLAFMNRVGHFILKMLTKKYKRGLQFSSFRIRGHRMDLGDGGRFRG